MSDPTDPAGVPGVGAGPVVHGAPPDPSATFSGEGQAPPSKVRGPSGWWYGVAAVLGVLGVVAGIAVMVLSIVSTVGSVDGYPRVGVPGSRVLRLEAREYVLYAERPYQRQFLGAPNPVVTVVDAGGAELPVRPAGVVTSTYDWGGRHGVSMGRVVIPEDGTYEVIVARGSSDATSVAFGREIGLSTVAGVFGGIAIAGIGVLVALVVVLIVAVRRGKAKRAAGPPLPPPSAAGAWSGPGPSPVHGAPPPPGASGWHPPPPAGPPGWQPAPPPGPPPAAPSTWSPPGSGSPPLPTGWTPPDGADGSGPVPPS